MVALCGGCAPGCYPGGDPWAAEVISVDEGEVCTSALVDVEDWRVERGDIWCFSRSDEYTEWDDLDLRVGDCVNLNVHHPVTVIESEIDCPS